MAASNSSEHYPLASVGQECRRSSGVTMRLQSSCQLGWQSSEGLTKAGGSSFKKVHTHDCWQEASVPHYVGFSTGFLSVLTTWQLASPRVIPKRDREREGSHSAFADLVLEVICHHFCYLLLEASHESSSHVRQGLSSPIGQSSPISWRGKYKEFIDLT